MMHHQVMHHLLHVPDTDWKAAFVNNPFTPSDWRGSAALGKTPSSPVTHKTGAAWFAKTTFKTSKFTLFLSPMLHLLFRSKAAAMAISSENAKNVSSVLCHFFLFFFFSNSSCPPDFPFPSWLLLSQQRLTASLLLWKKDAKTCHHA